MKIKSNFKTAILPTLIISSAIFSTTNTAIAQNNFKIYGVVDYGYSYRFDKKKLNIPLFQQNYNISDSNSRFDSGMNKPNRLGFEGSEDLGNGLKVIFSLERGFNVDTGNDKGGFNRQAYVGIQSENLGTLVGGRIYTPYYNFIASLDPFKTCTVGTYNNLTRDISSAVGNLIEQGGAALGYDLAGVASSMAEINDPLRVNNTLAYTSPKWSGFSFNAAFSNNALDNDSAVSNAQNTTFYSLGASLERSNYLLGINYHRMAMSKYQRDFGISKIDSLVLGGSYQLENLHNLKLSAFVNYSKTKFTEGTLVLGKNNITQINYLLGAEVPFGNHIVKGSFNYSHNSNNQFGKAYQIAVGYDYYFSKRTNFYAAYAFINNDDSKIVNNTITRYGRFATTSDSSNPGGGYQQAIQFGITHRF